MRTRAAHLSVTFMGFMITNYKWTDEEFTSMTSKAVALHVSHEWPGQVSYIFLEDINT